MIMINNSCHAWQFRSPFIYNTVLKRSKVLLNKVLSNKLGVSLHPKRKFHSVIRPRFSQNSNSIRHVKDLAVIFWC